jgi:hypothetical protein
MEASLLASAGIGSSTIAILFIAYKVFMKFKGHLLVSDCCGIRAEVGFDVRDMDPTQLEETGNHQVVLPHAGENPESPSARVQEPIEHQSQKETV